MEIPNSERLGWVSEKLGTQLSIIKLCTTFEIAIYAQVA